MIDRTTMSSSNDFFAATKANPSRKASQVAPVRREIQSAAAGDSTKPTETPERFADNLNTATVDRTAEKPGTTAPTTESPVATETSAESASTAVAEETPTTEVKGDVLSDEGTVAEWVAAFEQMTEKPAKPAETVSFTLPTADTIEANEVAPIVQSMSDIELPDTTVQDVNPMGYTDVITMPTESIAPAADPSVKETLTAATVISPAEFAAAQEAIQRAAAQTVRDSAAPGMEMRVAFTSAQAATAALRTKVVKQQSVPEKPQSASNIIDQRTHSQQTATAVAPEAPQSTQHVTATSASTADDQAIGPIQPSGAQTRAAEIEADPRPRTMPSVTPMATTETSAAPDVIAPESAAAKPVAAKVELPTPVTREQFTAANEPNVVKSVAGLIKDNGGEMRIRLDPPALGNVSVRVKMTGGAAEVSFVTPSGDAAKALGQSLHTLKQSLEAAGLQVDRINVRQAQPTDNQASTNSDQRGGDDPSTRDQRQNEQQRAREELARRWRHVIYGDDLDAAA